MDWDINFVLGLCKRVSKIAFEPKPYCDGKLKYYSGLGDTLHERLVLPPESRFIKSATLVVHCSSLILSLYILADYNMLYDFGICVSPQS